ncbi:hypothetical protein [Streptomyces sp. FH025]|uniref:hypothetical protein n=1 Tax=Streptomyces sp. FH025 TaxID=2815937 RepID=UPI001A9F2E88|nr:hypothetical protein [Streptomyces sp. FH025]MBO1417409.1 hypothetical protein [Streptomyces sp. FH025]
MQNFHAEATGLVSVERSQFGLWEEDEFAEGGSWMDLPLCDETPGVTLAEGAVKVRSSIRDHYAEVTLELTDHPVCPEGFRLLARVPYRSRTGRIEAWTLFSGPASVMLDLAGGERNFVLSVFWEIASNSDDRISVNLPCGVERFHFAFEPAAE